MKGESCTSPPSQTPIAFDPRQAAGDKLKLPSIKTRLTFFYGLATAILITITILFLYFTTLHILHEANRQFLFDEINVLKNLLETQPNNSLALRQEVIEVPYTETGSEYRYYIRLLDNKNHIVLETPQFQAKVKNANFFAQPPEDENIVAHWNVHNNYYVLMQAYSKIGKTKQSVLIQVALDITYQQNIINKYTHLLIFTLLIILLAAIFIGYFIANRAMSSLYSLTDATQKITVSSLHQRIEPKSLPRELFSLGMAFNAMLDRIETAFLHLTQFSADLAHELRTPINNLMGEAEIILSRPHSVTHYQTILESHLEELQRVSQIIENILFLARTENPKLDIKKEQIDVAEEIKLICEFYQAMADEKEITMTKEGKATLFANPIMFRRMLSNLLSNALKYTLPGGKIQFLVKTAGDSVEIVLKDNGIGIAEEHIPKLFNRFYRVDSARSRAAGGIGLGLPIVKSIVELHHGSILITSKPDEGTTITLIFPK